MNQPAVMQFETCRKGCTCIMVPKAKFDQLLVESHEFARWMFDLAMGQFYTSEKKLKYIKGDARERIIAVLKYRPEILEVVSSRYRRDRGLPVPHQEGNPRRRRGKVVGASCSARRGCRGCASCLCTSCL